MKALQTKLNEEKSARIKADQNSQEKERQLNMLSVDYRQMQQRLQKLEGECRQETEKVMALQSQIEQEHSKKNSLLSELSLQSSEVAHLKSRENQLQKEVSSLREAKRKFEEEISQIKNTLNKEILMKREYQDQLEAEQYFSRLYKTQANEHREEISERCREIQDLKEERTSLKHQVQVAVARADSEALARSIAEETVADLEKEKTIKEFELKDYMTKYRNEVTAKEAIQSAAKETESEFVKKLNQKNAENDELLQQQKKLQDELKQLRDSSAEELSKLKDKLQTEMLLKQVAVNKLTEVMNRRDTDLQSESVVWKNEEFKNNNKLYNIIFDVNTHFFAFSLTEQKGKARSSAELRKKEKEMRRLQQELSQEREKYNQLSLKLQDVQSQIIEDSHVSERNVNEILCNFVVIIFRNKKRIFLLRSSKSCKWKSTVRPQKSNNCSRNSMKPPLYHQPTMIPKTRKWLWV